ncbi:MAG: class I mannose-6-phosphate isomerase [Dysgonomonas sp.]|nr:class I mannose-6-phosphate isomerase [Dysgonomonas sp.]
MRKSNYIKHPFTPTEGDLVSGWENIQERIKQNSKSEDHIVVDCYLGVDLQEIGRFISGIQSPTTMIVDTYSLLKSEEELTEMQLFYLTDDVLFGYHSHFTMLDFFDVSKLEKAKKQIKEWSGKVIIYGYGASLVLENPNVLVYADMARWEIQLRSRKSKVQFLGTKKTDESVSTKHKRGYFIEWKVFDGHKRSLYEKVDYWLDTHILETPKMIDKNCFFKGLENTINSPFRVVPYFDAAPWGGQWMKSVCDLDKDAINYGWCFDCVPEENSLYLKINDTLFEMPSVNLVYLKSAQLLGTRVEARFGKEFPIRFDLLDTFEGGNLSLQTHPTTEYIRKNFGNFYTQDESYYIIDSQGEAFVYLGLKNGIEPDDMVSDLKKAEQGEIIFDADKYVNKIPANKHDHFLIPGGTVHCSAKNTLVLEISSTPNIFTFKLWDWARLGLDGKPRPINVSRGADVIDWSRNYDYVKKYLWNTVIPTREGDGYKEERTGLHENEFIETYRQCFSSKVLHKTYGSVNVLNLVEGEEAVIESPTGKFEPYVVHYAETFIIPAWLEEYTIAPYGKSEGKECITIKAYVRP